MQGHVDGLGSVEWVREEGDGHRLRVALPAELSALRGAQGCRSPWTASASRWPLSTAAFEVALIPHTWQHTTLGGLSRGDPVNLEVDVLAKHVERLLAR